jgi:hypothetical protein
MCRVWTLWSTLRSRGLRGRRGRRSQRNAVLGLGRLRLLAGNGSRGGYELMGMPSASMV